MAAAALAPIPASTAVCAHSADRVRSYLENARSRNTIRGYRSAFKQFEKWCSAACLTALPATPETVAMYLGCEAGQLKPATLQHRLAAVSKAHKTAGYSSPVKDNILVAETLKGIKRVHGTAQKQAAPLLTEDLRLTLRTLPQNLLGARDRALLLIGFTGAFRRSEVVSLDVSDLSFEPEGLRITLLRSKTDQEGNGREVAIPYGSHEATCAVRAMQGWLKASVIEDGPIFRPINRHGRLSTCRLSDHAVNIVIQRAVRRAELAGEFSGHSLRAGFVTCAVRAGEPERRIMRQTGHKSIEMVLRYVRQANAFQDNAALALGL